MIHSLTQCLWLSLLSGWDIQWGVSFHKVTRSFDHVVLQDHVKYFNCCISTTIRLMTTKLGKVVTYYKKLLPIKSQNTLAIKPGRVVPYNEELPSLKSHDSLITGSSDFYFCYNICRFRTQTRHWLLVIFVIIRSYCAACTCNVVNIGMDRFSLTSQGFPSFAKNCPHENFRKILGMFFE